MKEAHRVRLLSRDEEVDLATRARAGDKVARAELVSANVRFVVRCAHKWRGYGIPLEDIIGAGNIGLMIAVDKFDPARGNRFITLAVWWIQASIFNHITRDFSQIKICTTNASRKLFFRMRSVERELGDAATDALIAAKLGVREKDVFMMRQRLRVETFAPLDHAPDGRRSPAETLHDDRPNAETIIGDAQEGERIEQHLRCLSARERYVVACRYLAEETLTLLEVGKRLGLSRERVRQIEEVALLKLRRSMGAADACAA